ncbi:hypothetical protein GCM10020331_076980 [Ectobacillus funiculus]
MVTPFEEIDGVLGIVSGYTGGHTENPAYKEVCSETTGHYEAVQITFDPNRMPYERLLELYWQQIDPTDPGGQFYDRGQSYQTVIFLSYRGAAAAGGGIQTCISGKRPFSKKPIATAILPASTFYPAEEYHQDYHKKKTRSATKMYRQGSGRDAFIKKHWP